MGYVIVMYFFFVKQCMHDLFGPFKIILWIMFVKSVKPWQN